ncbi:MAG: phosphotransferase, partial [Candidatus Binatia bacterium]|nr:phosphotransferase [Candidatus Binatia bacterium]
GAETKAVLFRGDRSIAGKHDLRFEMDVMQVLEANGIKVPHIYGWVDSPRAFVMDWVDTEDRAPGMLHTAIEDPSTLSDERWQAMLHYMEDLAAVHAVPVSEFAHIRRLAKPPQTAAEIALHAPERMYQAGVHMGHIDTAFEFLQSWLRRNIPEHRTHGSFIAGDAGQFMSAGTEVLALLDFEIANIGDTHWDLACFRGRHPYENMGDIPALYRRYGEVTGTDVDLRVVGYHTVGFLQLSGIAAKFFMEPNARGGNWIEGVLEYGSITRRAYEAIAELQDIPLDYNLHLPEPTIQNWEDSGLRKLMVDIERLPTSSAFEPWERGLLHSIPSFLLNHARYRGWFEREALADIAQLTGRSFDDLVSADAAVSEIIGANDPGRDEELVRLQHRRILRFSMIAAGTDPNDENPLFHKLDPILS